jgi:hypothetical protein
MSKRNLNDERARAFDMYVHYGEKPDQIAIKLSVHVNSVRTWANQGKWKEHRHEFLLSIPASLRGIKRHLAKLVEQIDEKTDVDDPVSNNTINRIIKTVTLIDKIDAKYNELGTAMNAMTRFTEFLRSRNDSETLRGVSACLEDFYRSINANV